MNLDPARPEIKFDRVRLRRLADTIRSELGIKMEDVKLKMLHGRLQRRLYALGLDSIGAYEERLHDPAYAEAERTELFDLATTNKTDFFREPAHFTYLVEHALPALSERRDRWTCRVWCAGCSSGQEVYTLAMVLDDYAQAHPGFSFEIIATDISSRVLREAARATYPIALAEPIPAHLRQRYLLRGKGERAGFVRVAPELRSKVRFGRLNFMDDQYALPGKFDVVFFRNVMIYFDRPTQQQVLRRQAALLRPGGFLFVGHSESTNGLDIPLRSVHGSVLRKEP